MTWDDLKRNFKKLWFRRVVVVVTETLDGKSTWKASGVDQYHAPRPDKWKARELKAKVEQSLGPVADVRKAKIYRKLPPERINLPRDYFAPIILGVILLYACFFYSETIDFAQQRADGGYYFRAAIINISLGFFVTYSGYVIGRGTGIYSQTLHPLHNLLYPVITLSGVMIFLLLGAIFMSPLPEILDADLPFWRGIYFVVSPDAWLSPLSPWISKIVGLALFTAALWYGLMDSQALGLSKTDAVEKLGRKFPIPWKVYKLTKWEIELPENDTTQQTTPTPGASNPS
ncbi:hypothetical protein ACX80Z_15360 [Arthrobacter sp. TMT4-20]